MIASCRLSSQHADRHFLVLSLAMFFMALLSYEAALYDGTALFLIIPFIWVRRASGLPLARAAAYLLAFFASSRILDLGRSRCMAQKFRFTRNAVYSGEHFDIMRRRPTR